ncbi:protein PHYTOCHROME KINASE SUBSTRATE 1 isoform X2 [Manihot esculenta]|uniref:Phytochrome kinase substrate 1 n=3 Tax=Manihot esculenta TaxID=3983 RepID=A0A2C9WLZ4_MANES|nr:protein PHYTOCHROME KINASE SUBSTRATE 1 isoform X2 [Manihot esculenta]XP_021617658.1 protein PHYTOCHROME KINASE SUBSTRATE 1 isoform X2 [Manihot esculenta]KAG8663195.1 hypothetical protein MANES_01G186300v8 [Manihot esculenta]OAY61408.1 hypothetical protein MANES_01G186300v8 [Manihot esculenta]
MVMATLTSVASLTNSRGNLHDVSFPSFLSNSDDTFVRKLAESNRNISAQDVEEHHYLGNKKEDGEIGIFGAEKYFNGCMDEDSPRLTSIIPKHLQPKKDEQLNDHTVPMKPNIHPETPSINSESTWNSQSALLQSVQRKNSEAKTNKAHGKIGKNFLAVLGCKCSCSDKDFIDVDDDDEHIGEISFKRSSNAPMLQGKAISEEFTKGSLDLDDKLRSGSPVEEEDINCQNLEKLGIGMKKETCFSFPTSNSEAGNLSNKFIFRQEEVKQRKSLEVFGSPVHDKRSKSFRIGRKLSMFSWEEAPRMEEIDYSATSGGVYNDNESDASSDLFEIESHTGKFTQLLARQGSNATSDCPSPTTGYAPSEASIEWSVVTASAADFSVISDYEELRPPTTLPSPIKTFLTTVNAKPETSKETPRRRSSISFGCNSHKAVRVAGDAYKTNDKVFDPLVRRLSDSYMPLTRLHSESKLMDSDPRQRKHALSSHLLPGSHPSQSFRPSHIQQS